MSEPWQSKSSLLNDWWAVKQAATPLTWATLWWETMPTLSSMIHVVSPVKKHIFLLKTMRGTNKCPHVCNSHIRNTVVPSMGSGHPVFPFKHKSVRELCRKWYTHRKRRREHERKCSPSPPPVLANGKNGLVGQKAISKRKMLVVVRHFGLTPFRLLLREITVINLNFLSQHNLDLALKSIMEPTLGI